MGGVALVVLFAVVLEATCRLEDYIRYGTPAWSRVRAKEDLLVLDSLGKHGRPNAQFGKWALNNVGMRGPDVAVTKPAGDVRIVVVGASETFGLYESPGHDYPRLLEDSCARAWPERRAPASGQATLRCSTRRSSGCRCPRWPRTFVCAWRRFIRTSWSRIRRPCTTSRRPRRIGRVPTARGARSAVAVIAALPRALDRMHDAIKQVVPDWLVGGCTPRGRAAQRHEPPGWRFTTVPADRLTAYETDLRRLVGTVHAVGATPVLVTHVNASMDNRPGRRLDRTVGASVPAGDGRRADRVRLDGRRGDGARGARFGGGVGRSGQSGAAGAIHAVHGVLCRLCPLYGHRAERFAAAITPAVARAAHLDDGCAPPSVGAMK